MNRILLQSFRDGAVQFTDAPVPSAGPGELVVATGASVVSAGTERMLLDFGRSNLLAKARKQPDRVVEVAQKARTDGVAQTFASVRSKLDQPTTLGYASAGTVVDIGGGVEGWSVGDRVACTGSHAMFTAVPSTLAARIPEGVPFEDAAFASIASVALQGIRLAQPTLGEHFVVAGLGLVGLIAVQLLQANGCSVLGIDPDPARREMATSFGATTAAPGSGSLEAAAAFSGGRGVDGVLICASTKSSEPIHDAAEMCRKRGRLVLVGVTGLDLKRADFYEKELTFQVSSSYGPGRYDPAYEDRSQDYPIGHVRWTAGRNLEAVLGLLQAGELDVARLVTHALPFDRADEAYEALLNDGETLGIVLQYPPAPTTHDPSSLERDVVINPSAPPPSSGAVGVIGAGNFADRVLLPALAGAGANIEVVASRHGTSAATSARRAGARRASTDVDGVFADPAIGTIVVATRHDTHAGYTKQALEAGKHVLVEKPLAITGGELDDLIACVDGLAADGTSVPLVGVGFNRRFAPISQQMRVLLADDPSPCSVILTMNAGEIPANHWTQDPEVGGGRIVGEACHLIDLARFLIGHPITEVTSHFMGGVGTLDTATITLTFDDGSIATVHYLANGAKGFPKERVEVFSRGRVLVNDNFRTMKPHSWPGARTTRLRKQDKGHSAAVQAFLAATRSGGPAPIPWSELVEVSRASLRAAEIG